MTTADLAYLRLMLANLTKEEICSLETFRPSWPPQLQDEPPHAVIDGICNSLQSLQSLELRLRCIASIQCQLISLNLVKPWQLYRLATAPTWEGCYLLAESTSTAIQLHDYDVTKAWNMCGSALHGCLLISSLQSPCPLRIPAYIVLWPGQPLLAISSLQYGIQCGVVSAVSAALHCGYMELQGLISDDLDWAYHVAVDFIESTLPQPAPGHLTTNGHGEVTAVSVNEPGDFPV
ncbi:hypothetical protein V5799_012045 [Amblyomma americanum]|uniref:Uncharacterized protein n=1 Tax=Amblyomma americanum TaxID=6943 RepID=A0AAQ4EFG6_AMBAM